VSAGEIAALEARPASTLVGVEIYQSRDDAPELFAGAASSNCRIIGLWTTDAR
jgi:hypothetical protein